MLSRLILFAALSLVCPGTAFPFSELSVAAPSANLGFTATQLLSLHDGTYLALINSFLPVTDLALNPRVRTVPFLSQGPVSSTPQTNIVARVHLSNDSVIWAYVINDFQGPAYAVVDDSLSIFVVGDAAFSPGPRSFNGFRVVRFSVGGEAIWAELYTSETPGITSLSFDWAGSPVGPLFVDLAGPRTLAIASSSLLSSTVITRVAFFIDTITRKVRQVRFPIPNGPPGTLLSAGVAADSASGVACFADVEDAPTAVSTQRLFVQCANAAGGSKVVSRVLVPFQKNVEWAAPRMIMTDEGEGKAAVLYVVAVRRSGPERRGTVPRYPLVALDETMSVNEMLLFKLNPTTLEYVEWESGRTSMKPTTRKLLWTTPLFSFFDRADSLEYIRDRNTLVVLFVSSTLFSEIETLPDGTIVFRGNAAMGLEQPRNQQWLLYFGNDPEPTAVRIPDDPRPNGEQDEFDRIDIFDLEISEDKRDLYLFGSLVDEEFSSFGETVTVLFPLPKLTKPCAESPAIGDDLGDGVGESSEPSPEETADASGDEELMASPNPLQEQDI